MHDALNSLDDPAVKHYQDLISQKWSVWNFFARFSDVKSWGNPIFFYSTKMLMITKPDACPFEKEKLLAALLFSPITM